VVRALGLAVTSALVATAWKEPGGFAFWTPLRTFLVAVLLGQAAWAAWKSPRLSHRALLVVGGVALALVQWGFPALSGTMCGQATQASLRAPGALLELVLSDCGATTAERRRVVLTTGEGMTRRRRVLVDAYMYPDIELLGLDERTVRVRLRFSTPADSFATLVLPTDDPGPTRSYYRGEPSD